MARPQKRNVYHADAAALGALAEPTRDAGAPLLDAASKMHQAIYGLDWQGQGRNAAETRADRELAYDRTTEAGCDALADAYANACKTMQPMIQSLQSQGQGLEADCFDVSEDWHVTDKFDYAAGEATMIHQGASEQAATDRMTQLATERGHEATTATATLQRLADQLGDADHDTAAAILTATNQLDPHRRPARPHIQTVDRHTFKEDPPPPPGPPGNPLLAGPRSNWHKSRPKSPTATPPLSISRNGPRGRGQIDIRRNERPADSNRNEHRLRGDGAVAT